MCGTTTLLFKTAFHEEGELVIFSVIPLGYLFNNRDNVAGEGPAGRCYCANAS